MTDETRRFDRRTVLGRTAGALAALMPLTGAAVAQEGNESATPTDAPTETEREEEGPIGDPNADLTLSPTTTISSWRYGGGSWSLGIEADTPTRLTVTDASQVARVLSEGDGPSAGTARYEGYNVSTGERSLTFTGESYQGMAAITVSAAGGERLAVLRTDALAGGRQPVGFTEAAGAAVAGSVATGAVAVRQTRKKRDEDEKEAERIL
jgi:hypothetical protein